MKGKRGSYNWTDGDRPRWRADTRLIRSHDYHRSDSSYAFTVQKGINPDGEKAFRTGRKNVLPFSDRLTFETKADWLSGMGDEPLVLYRLPELIAALKANPGCKVLIPEGEKDVETAIAHGYIATCNPMGAMKWRDEYSPYLKGAHVIVVEDNDERGRKHAKQVAWSVADYALSVKIMHMPDGIKDLTELMELEKDADKKIG
jgi:DNA primase